ncbi:MAG: hypothetical protein JWO44_190 [Bacteroidetes bacterium]|nr:hypothetical protein [Bacteroidota bacterium]
MHRLGFERTQEWTNWKKAGKRPAFIPSNPDLAYKNQGWIDWHNWIGFSYLPFTDARTYNKE